MVFLKERKAVLAGLFFVFTVTVSIDAATVLLDKTSISGTSFVTFNDDTFVLNGSTISDGIVDWVFFGAGSGVTRVEKASASYIGSLTGTNSQTASGAFYQSWTGGTPTPTGMNSRGEVYQGTGSSSGGGTSMTLLLDLPTGSSDIYLVMSNYYTDADLTVSVDGSPTTFTNIFESTSGSVSKLFEISVIGADAGDQVTITLNNYDVNSSWANLVPWAVAVVPEPATLGLLAIGGFFALLRRRRN